MITAILSGIAAKLAGLGLAAKVGTGIAAATIATAGVATVAPVINPGAPRSSQSAAASQTTSLGGSLV